MTTRPVRIAFLAGAIAALAAPATAGAQDAGKLCNGKTATVLVTFANGDTGYTSPGVLTFESGPYHAFYAFGSDAVMVGTDGNDNMIGDGAGATICSRKGDDLVRGSTIGDYLAGGQGNDFVWGNDGNDEIFGVSGNDMVYGDAGDDVVHGDGGNDLVQGGGGDDTLFGDAGADTLRGDSDDQFPSPPHPSTPGDGDTCDGGVKADTADADCETVTNIP